MTVSVFRFKKSSILLFPPHQVSLGADQGSTTYIRAPQTVNIIQHDGHHQIATTQQHHMQQTQNIYTAAYPGQADMQHHTQLHYQSWQTSASFRQLRTSKKALSCLHWTFQNCLHSLFTLKRLILLHLASFGMKHFVFSSLTICSHFLSSFSCKLQIILFAFSRRFISSVSDNSLTIYLDTING